MSCAQRNRETQKVRTTALGTVEHSYRNVRTFFGNVTCRFVTLDRNVGDKLAGLRQGERYVHIFKVRDFMHKGES